MQMSYNLNTSLTTNFWIELPLAICDISKEILTYEDIQKSNLLINSSKVNKKT